MIIFNVIIILILFIGVGIILHLILRDPIFITKSFLRGLKNGNWQLKIASFPIWGPIGIIDKIFDLKIFIEEFEDASVPVKINFNEFDKFLLIDNCELSDIERILQSFQGTVDINEYNYHLDEVKICAIRLENKIIVKLEENADFTSINSLIQYIGNSAPRNKIYNIKGIFLNKANMNDSYFVFIDTSYSLKLIGKTYKNKKIYVNLDPEIEANEILYFNQNIDYFKNFEFDKFSDDIIEMKFKEIELKS